MYKENGWIICSHKASENVTCYYVVWSLSLVKICIIKKISWRHRFLLNFSVLVHRGERSAIKSTRLYPLLLWLCIMHNHSYYVMYVNRPGYGRNNIATLHSEIVYVGPFVRLTFNFENVCASKLCTCVYTYNTITFFSVKFIVWSIVGYVCLHNFSIQGCVCKISSVNYYNSQLPSPMRQALQVSRYIFNIKHYHNRDVPSTSGTSLHCVWWDTHLSGCLLRKTLFLL